MRSDELDAATYISLTTFKRDGTPVATPVWLTSSDGRYLVRTPAHTWKVRRLRNDPTVELAVSDFRGQVDPAATRYRGKAHMLEGSDAEQARAAIRAKYGLMDRLIAGVKRLHSLITRSPDAGWVALEITVDGPSS